VGRLLALEHFPFFFLVVHLSLPLERFPLGLYRPKRTPTMLIEDRDA
jgi:hypothetical protein